MGNDLGKLSFGKAVPYLGSDVRRINLKLGLSFDTERFEVL